MSGYPTVAEPDEVLTWAAAQMWEAETTAGRPAAWLRAMPSGYVHFSRDWCARIDGRINAECGKTPIFWPVGWWPRAKVCPSCADAFREFASAEVEQEKPQ